MFDEHPWNILSIYLEQNYNTLCLCELFQNVYSFEIYSVMSYIFLQMILNILQQATSPREAFNQMDVLC